MDEPWKEGKTRFEGDKSLYFAFIVIGESDSSGKDDHVDLCVLKYSASAGVLEVSPNFTFHRKPYRIEVNKLFGDSKNAKLPNI